MSWLRQRASGNAVEILARGRDRRLGRGSSTVTQEQAMRQSVAWACRSLRADLVSTMPLDVFKKASDGTVVEMPKPPVLLTPGGQRCRWLEWSYSSQMDLDGYGNAVGIIEERDRTAFQRPSVIRLQSAAGTTIRQKDGEVTYRFPGSSTWYREDEVWHEKQYTLAGSPVGLSPIGYAAMALNANLSAAEFAANWFSNGARPAAHLRNKARKLNKGESLATKENFKTQVGDGDVFVSGNDWEYHLIDGKASDSTYLEQQRAGNLDICRFLGVPGDLVEVYPDGTATITYANITQRNLQFLIMKLNPTLIRREDAFTWFLLPTPRYAKYNRSALLQMDPKTRAETIAKRIESRTLTPSEGRGLDELPPLTPEDIAEFQTVFPSKTPTPVPTGGTS